MSEIQVGDSYSEGIRNELMSRYREMTAAQSVEERYREIDYANARIKELEAVNLALIAERDQLRAANGDLKDYFDELKAEYDALLKEREDALKQKPVAYSQQNGLETSFCSLQYQREYNVPLETLKPLYSKPMSPAIPEGYVMVPVEADAVMVQAGIDCELPEGSSEIDQYNDYCNVYRAMIAASQKGGA